MQTESYACYNLNNEERINSSSGGLYPLFAKRVLDDGGLVYAACYNEVLDVVHRRIDTIEDLWASQGSKYVKSSLGTVFQEIIDEISNGKKVLFVGLPCQCGGLNSLIEETNSDRSRIVLIDFICHGIPGNTAWHAYKNSMKERGKPLISVNMRDKSTGWTNGNYAWREKTSVGDTIVTPRRQVSFMKGMLANLYLRPSCFECAFKGVDRCTDITIGDYWGVWDHLPQMDDNKGTSIVLIHSENGMDLFNAIKSYIIYMDADIEKVALRNACLVESTKYNPKSKKFYKKLFQGEDFIKLVNNLTKETFPLKIKRVLKKCINLMKGWFCAKENT